MLLLLIGTSWAFGATVFWTNVYAGLALPLTEETLFRGWAWGRLQSAPASGAPAQVWAFAVTTVLFGMWHLGHADVLAAHPFGLAFGALGLASKVVIGLGLGAVLGGLRWWTGRVYVPVLARARGLQHLRAVSAVRPILPETGSQRRAPVPFIL